jgi:shikimate 5-dehydrogenase
MDTVYYPMHTLLTMEAKRRDCIVVYGVQMFINQAVRQLQLWFRGVNQVKALKHIGVEAFDKWMSNCPRTLK